MLDPRITDTFAAEGPLPSAEPLAPVPNGSTVLQFLRVSQQYFSEEAAAKLSVGSGFGSGTADANHRAYALRYEALLESKPEPRMVGDVEMAKIRAIGVVLEISVIQSNANVRFDIFSVAAAVQLGFAKAQYSTKVLPATDAALRALVPERGVFDIGNCETVISGIERAKNALAANADSLVPETYYRPSRVLPTLEKELQFGQSVAFAVRYISKGKTAQTAADDAGDRGLDGTAVRLVYESFWPDLKDSDNPPRDVIEQARSWLADGFHS